jgi:hypothetical protein
MGFAHGVAPTQNAGYCDDQEAGFDKELAAVEPVDRGIF